MVSLEKDILKSAQRIDALKNKMNALASVKTPTQEYQEISKQIADAEKKQASLNDRMSKFIELGGKTNSKQFKSMQYDAAELENTIRYAKGELQDLVDTGKAFTLGDSTSEFNNLSQQLSAEQSKLNDLTSRYQKAQNVAEMADRFEQVGSAAKTAFSVTKDGAVTAGEAIAKMGVSLGGAAKRLASFAGKAVLHLSGIKGASKTSGNAVERLGKRVLSLAKTVFVFGILRRALTAFKNGIQDGFGTYLEYDTSLKNAISGLKAQLNGLKGSLASAFAPIVSAIVPYLSTLISWLTAASNAIAQFIAVLTGHTSYKKAVANVGAVGAAADGAAGSLGSAAKAAEDLEKALGDYDELKVIEQPKDSGSGGGGGGGAGSAGDITYEEVDISTAVSDFAEKVKQAWEQSDFTEVGATIGEKLNDALENIPWDSIQQTAKNIGKDVATLINGFIEVDDLGNNIGSTIAEAINTGILGLESFSSNLHWDSVGKFVSDGITGTLNTIQWDNLKTTADNLGTGIAVALNDIMTEDTFGAVGESFAKAVRAVVSGAHKFVEKSDFKGWGRAIGTMINNYFKDLDWYAAGLTFSGGVKGIIRTLTSAITTVSWDNVGASIGDMIKGLDWKGILSSLGELIWEAIKAGIITWKSAFDAAPIETTIITAIAALHFTGLGSIVGTTIWDIIKAQFIGLESVASANIAANAFALNLANAIKTALGSAAVLAIIAGGVALIYKGVEEMLSDPDFLKNKDVENYIKENPGSLGEGAETPEIEVQITGNNGKFKKEVEESAEYLNKSLPGETAINNVTKATEKLSDKLKNLSKQSKFTISVKGLDATKEEKIKVIAEVTKTDYSSVPNNDKIIDNCYAEIVRAYQNPGYTPQLYGANAVMTKATDSITNKNLYGFNAGLNTKTDNISDKNVGGFKALVNSWDKARDFLAGSIDGFKALMSNWGITGAFVAGGINGFTSLLDYWSKSNSFTAGNIGGFTALMRYWSESNGFSAGNIGGFTALMRYWSKSSSFSAGNIGGFTALMTDFKDKISAAAKILTGFVAAVASTKKAEGGVYQSGTWSDLPQKALGGIKQTSFWKNIPQFASGGSPHGTMFLAGEAGPEIVGHVGGRTEVLNKSQIASAIYSAVCSAMRESINALGYAVLSHMTDCTNMVIANMAEIAADMRRTMDMSIPNIQYAGVPSGYMPDVNRINAVYQSVPSSAQMIDYDKLASAVANKISWNMQLENVMYLDRDVVYQSMVEVDREMINQTGHSGFGV